ncbi:MAG TPA: hypothetical protein VFT99_02555, partial [Roseiflexaceae bacterium]|nr:hypothetical protein [Roseiflexaceae bacterium]
MTGHTRTASQPTLFWSIILLLSVMLIVQPAARAASPVFLVKNINSLTGSDPVGLKDIGGVLYFQANEDWAPRTLWRSDGTEAGTYKVDLGSNVVEPFVPIPFEDKLLIIAKGSSSGYALFANDGSSSNSTLLKDNFAPSSELGIIGNAWYFVVAGTSTELWKTDGTAAGTLKVSTLSSGTYVRGEKVVLDNVTYFTLENSLWKTDGTTAGTAKIKEFTIGVGSLTVLNSKLIFVADDGTSGGEVWTSDGTAQGTALLVDITPGSGTSLFPHGPGLFRAGNRVVFRVGNPSYTLWSTDGTVQGTQKIRSISSFASSIAGNGNLVFFAGDTPESGWELWVSDGTVGGTHQVLDQQPGPDGAQPVRFFIVDQKVVYVTLGGQIWVSDGTESGTAQISEPFGVSSTSMASFVPS